MRVNEFKDVDEMATVADRKHLTKTKWEAPVEVEDWLYTKGFRKIGEGWYSAVYRKANSKKVVKFSERQDTCYLEFAKHAKANPNKHFPIVYDFIEYEGHHGLMFITVLEYLTTVPFEKIDWSTEENRQVLAYLHDVGAMPSHIDDDETISRILGKAYIEGDDEGNSVDLEQVIKKLKKGNTELGKAVNALDKVSPAECMFDIHNDNIMYRKSDKSVVIIDPYSDA